MRRTALCLALGLIFIPAAAEAQVRILAGAGVTNPISDLNDVTDVGWHAMGGAQLDIATLPISLRGDGGYHSFGEQGSNPQTSVLSGAVSLVVTLPGVGLSPYILGGVGVYRTSLDIPADDPTSDTGIHGAFGVDIGAVGFGGFAELRGVSVSTEASGNFRFLTATLGLRL
jgi:hypothetical protein